MPNPANTTTGNCPTCHRDDISRRVVIGAYERFTCRMCADGYKRTPGVTIEVLTSRQLRNAASRVL
jgi:hypothetical protein